MSIEFDALPVDVLRTRMVAEGRKAISAHLTEDDMDWSIPVLFM